MRIDEDELAFNALAEKGPGEHLFGVAHTIAHYQTAFYDSDLDNNQTFETWSEQGSSDMATRANRRWKKLLEEYQPPDIDAGKDGELRDFIERKKRSMEDAWY